jgi:enoyl-CoA hydratase
VTDSVQFELRDSVAVVRIDDGKVNALSPALVEALLAQLPRAQKEAKALLLVGRPGSFSAGFDLKVMFGGPEAATDLLRKGSELFMRLYEHPQPVVAAVTGHAIAGGVLLAASCDLRIGTEGPFKIGLNEISAGMPVPILAHSLARDRLDPRRLTESVLGARMYDPVEAVTVGWLDRVADPEAVEEQALELAAALAKLPAQPYARTKASLRRQTIDHVRATLEADITSLRG